MLTNILFFIAGGLVATIALFTVGYMALRSDAKKVKDLLEKAKQEQEDQDTKMKTVHSRLKRAAEISTKQLEIAQAIDQPSKNSLHSKYKNQLVGEVKELEKEKRALLRSIIQDGFDPDLTITNQNGEKEQISLSQYMIRNGIEPQELDDSVPPPPPGKTNKSKFVVIKGGKNDTTH